MEYELKYIAKEYQHGWSIWLERNGKKVMIGSAIKTEQEVNNLINNIKLEIEERYEPEKELKDLKKQVKVLNEYKVKYDNLLKKLSKLTQ